MDAFDPLSTILTICFAFLNFSLFISGHVHPNLSKSQLLIDDDAIRQLSELFDISSLKRARNIRAEVDIKNGSDSDYIWPSQSERSSVHPEEAAVVSPPVPAYMRNLYNTIADRNGVMRIPNPYHANLIKSFPNKQKESQKSTRLFFDISSLSPFETILHAELHIQIKRTPLPPEVQWNNVRPHWSGLSANPNRTTVYVFQQSGSSVENRRLLTSAELAPGATTSTHVLQIGSAVRDWIYQPRDNHGLVVEIFSNERDEMGKPLRYELDQTDERRPTVVLFMDDGRSSRNPKYRIKDTVKQSEYLKMRALRLGQPDILTSFKNTAKIDSLLSSVEDKQRFRRSPTSKEQTKSRFFAVKKYQRRPPPNKPPKKPKGPCRRHDLYVSFEDIGWSSWIISPKGFQAFHCRGDCHFPIGQESKPSNHATVISIINHMKFHKRVSAPCCVPDKLYSISLLYFDSEQNVILKQYDDMVAQSCACR